MATTQARQDEEKEKSKVSKLSGHSSYDVNSESQSKEVKPKLKQ